MRQTSPPIRTQGAEIKIGPRRLRRARFPFNWAGFRPGTTRSENAAALDGGAISHHELEPNAELAERQRMQADASK